MQFAIPFDVIEADVTETRLAHETPDEMALRLAQLKARTVYDQLESDSCVLGGDTIVAMGDQVFGKPANRAQAMDMLAQLSGKTHSVFSAVALINGEVARSLLSETKVTFKELSDQTISDYCHTDDPYDKAGAYGIQAGAGSFVADLQGSYSGVIGLPLWHVHQLLMSPGVMLD